jgi:hypothetical protein
MMSFSVLMRIVWANTGTGATARAIKMSIKHRIGADPNPSSLPAWTAIVK